MAKIEPFCGYHYNPEIIDDFSKVVCPPYDVISPSAQEEFYQKNSYNIIRLILSKELAGDTDKENKYTRAAGYLNDWVRRNVLVRDAQPGLYFYEQVFEDAGKKKKRLGFMALMRLDEEGEAKSVHPHEHTHTAPKEDRLELIKHVEANLSPIFTIFSDKEKIIRSLFEKYVQSEKPFFKALDSEGNENRAWRVDRRDIIGEVKSFFADKELFIADGHHRHEVARMFRDYKRRQDSAHFKDAYNYILTYFTALEDDGLCIWPTHRLIKNVHFSLDTLNPLFNVKESGSLDELVLEMKSREDQAGVFGLYKDRKFYLLRLADKRECNRFIQDGPKEYKNLDVVILHKIIFDHLLKIQLPQINYEINLKNAVGEVDAKNYDALFLLNSTKIEQIRSIALGGEVMPQKSTYFYPKLLTGILINKFS